MGDGQGAQQNSILLKDKTMPVKFFHERMHRAMQMDMANKLAGRPTHYWVTADEWLEAYKRTLSSKEKKEFEKEYARLELQLEVDKHLVEGTKEKLARKLVGDVVEFNHKP